MKFLANENFPRPSISFLRKQDVNIVSVAPQSSGISDEEVMHWAMNEGCTILTHDRDYGELIFKLGFKPKAGVIYYRLQDFEPVDPAKILLSLIDQKIFFSERLTVVNEHSVRQRHY